MFDLEQAITEWRRQMAAGGIKSPAVLEELEAHLREDVERQVKSGWQAPVAFEAAARRIGPAGALKKEFGKIVHPEKRRQMKRISLILGGLFGMLFGFAMVWPQLGMLHRTGAIPHLPALVAGAVIVLAAAGVTFYSIRRHQGTRGRKLTGWCLIAVGGSITAVNASTLLELSSTERLWWPPVVAAVVAFFASCLYFNRTPPVQPSLEA